VERDGNLITASGPEAAEDFARTILKAMKGE
jgi:putative intracellular protease/amidase